MSKLRKIVVATSVALAGFAGVLFTVAPGAALGSGDAVSDQVTVLADSPWDGPTP